MRFAALGRQVLTESIAMFGNLVVFASQLLGESSEDKQMPRRRGSNQS
jgi:hypothetical protein